MQSLLDFIVKYYHWLLFMLLEGISFVLLFQFNHYHSSVWLTTANSVVGQIYAWEQEVIRFVHLDEANRDLTERNLLLEQQNAILREHLLELNHDSTFVEQMQQEMMENMTFIPGKVITNSILQRDNYITIDVGEADGVRPEMGVVSGTGIVGIVYMTSTHYSIVMPLLNSKSRISCRLHGTGYFGYLKWDVETASLIATKRASRPGSGGFRTRRINELGERAKLLGRIMAKTTLPKTAELLGVSL